jgi:hypothetical protein
MNAAEVGKKTERMDSEDKIKKRKKHEQRSEYRQYVPHKAESSSYVLLNWAEAGFETRLGHQLSLLNSFIHFSGPPGKC